MADVCVPDLKYCDPLYSFRDTSWQFLAGKRIAQIR